MVITAAHRQSFEEKGFTLIPSFLSADEINMIAEDINWLVEKQLGFLGISPVAETDPVKKFSRNLIAMTKAKPELQACIYDEVNRRPWVYQLAASERMLSIAKALLSEKVAIHPRLNMVMSMPNDEWHLAIWHQDGEYACGMRMIAYMPIQPTNASNGGLMVAPGMHKHGLFEHAKRPDWGVDSKFITIAKENVDKFPEILQLELNAGDLLLFDRYLPHSASINASPEVRFALTLRYSDLSEEFFAKRGWKWQDISEVGLKALASKKQ